MQLPTIGSHHGDPKAITGGLVDTGVAVGVTVCVGVGVIVQVAVGVEVAKSAQTAERSPGHSSPATPSAVQPDSGRGALVAQ